MNTANLQLEGLLMAMASINRMLVAKGLLDEEEIDLALCEVEANLSSEDKSEDLSPANRDAIAFPVRLLRLANRHRSDTDLPAFTALTRMVARMKEPYGDQM